MQRYSTIHMTILMLATCLGASAVWVSAQAPGVEIVKERKEVSKPLVERANALKSEGALLSLEEATNQLARTSCSITLPEPHTETLTSRDIWRRSKAAHVRLGWHYRCNRCEKWHQSLAGGYFISTDGLIATCHHVVDKDSKDYREAYLVAVDDQGNVLPVTEILAANKGTDTAIIRAKVEGAVTPLPLNPHVYPGDDAWCYSDPLGRSGYFSKGIVNRFYVYGKEEDTELLRMEVSTDWAPGSSGAAVLDGYGNAIGHVSQISSAGTRKQRPRSSKQNTSTNAPGHVASHAQGPMMIFHCASRAADVLDLVKETGTSR